MPAFFFTIGSVESKFRPNSSLTSMTSALISVESAIPMQMLHAPRIGAEAEDVEPRPGSVPLMSESSTGGVG